ncbi:hypothetical protein [Corynebacterium poyangense]|uniref:hypothetical protein n=1 Tax=Corynebacterium poyangense TaxID=2684405 RepID=UPI001CCA1AE1|nr:hypothetical protein [Corynebacterium poyangense]
MAQLQEITGTPEPKKRYQRFSGGRELIEAVKARREQAEAIYKLAREVVSELGDKLDQYDPDLIDGVRVLWISKRRAARDETAFRHALKTGHRLRSSGQRMKDNLLIDAYEHGYNVAQQVGSDGRSPEMPRCEIARRWHTVYVATC